MDTDGAEDEEVNDFEKEAAEFQKVNPVPRSGFLLVGLIEHRRCEISGGETFEIKSPEMPGKHF